MNTNIRHLLSQITALEDELRTAVREQETHLFYQINGTRIEFEGTIRETHRRLKMGMLRWFVAYRPRNLITGPIIYVLGLPLVFFNFCVTLYQALCFPIYRIAKVRRADYFVFDRRHLEYLNVIERFHCTYCAYANGLLAYACEIAARTESIFAPLSTPTACSAPTHVMNGFWHTAQRPITTPGWKSSALRLKKKQGSNLIIHITRPNRGYFILANYRSRISFHCHINKQGISSCLIKGYHP